MSRDRDFSDAETELGTACSQIRMVYETVDQFITDFEGKEAVIRIFDETGFGKEKREALYEVRKSLSLINDQLDSFKNGTLDAIAEARLRDADGGDN